MKTIPAIAIEAVMARGNAAKVTTKPGFVTVEREERSPFSDPETPVPEAYLIRAKQDGPRLITDGAYISLDRAATFELIVALLALVKKDGMTIAEACMVDKV